MAVLLSGLADFVHVPYHIHLTGMFVPQHKQTHICLAIVDHLLKISNMTGLTIDEQFPNAYHRPTGNN